MLDLSQTNHRNQSKRKEIQIICHYNIGIAANQLTKKHHEKIIKISGLCNLGREIVIKSEREKLLALYIEILQESKKLSFCINQLYELFDQKCNLETGMRLQMEKLIYKICDENLKLKMIILKRTLNKQIQKSALSLWNGLMSI